MLSVDVNRNASRICQELLQTLPRRKSVSAQDAPSILTTATDLQGHIPQRVHRSPLSELHPKSPTKSSLVTEVSSTETITQRLRHSNGPQHNSGAIKAPFSLQGKHQAGALVTPRRSLANQIAITNHQNAHQPKLTKSPLRRHVPQAFEPMASFLISDLALRSKTQWSRSISYHTNLGESLAIRALRVSRRFTRTKERLCGETILYVVQGSIRQAGRVVITGCSMRFQALELLDLTSNNNEDAIVLVISNALSTYTAL